MPTASGPKRGEIWRIDLEPTRGDEMRKTRPCVILNEPSIGRLALRLVVLLTGWQEPFANFPWCVKLFAVRGTGLSKTSAADVFQMRSVSLLRVVDRVGVLPNEDTQRIADAIAFTIGASINGGPAAP